MLNSCDGKRVKSDYFFTVYLLDCLPLKRISLRENSFSGVGEVIFLVVTFGVVAAGFTIDLAVCLAFVFGCFTSSVIFALLLVALLAGAGFDSLFCVVGGAAHWTKQVKTSRSRASWTAVHHIELKKSERVKLVI